MSKYREKVLNAFDENGCYFHKTYLDDNPYRPETHIDEVGHLAILLGAALKVGDDEVANRCKFFIDTTLRVADNARSFSTVQINNDWKKSKNMVGYWYYEKPQDSAGPMGIEFANACGANIKHNFDIMNKAKLITLVGSAFGSVVKGRFGGYIKQHINTVWFSYLATGNKVPKSMRWMCEHNPFYSYIAGIKCEIVDLPLERYTQYKSVTCTGKIQSMGLRKPSAWTWKTFPYTKCVYAGSGTPQRTNVEYTPAFLLAAEYLQKSL